MDRVAVNLVSIVLAGAGLFTVLTAWNAPEANHSFYGNNPFLIKREAIKTVSDWAFSLMAVAALAIQLGAEILGDTLPARLYTRMSYVWVAVGSFIAVGGLVWLIAKLCRTIARRSWEPVILAGQVEVFRFAAHVVDHDGRQPGDPPEISNERRVQNVGQATDFAAQVEKLLDIAPLGPLASRVERLRPKFNGVVALVD